MNQRVLLSIYLALFVTALVLTWTFDLAAKVMATTHLVMWFYVTWVEEP